MEKYRLEIGVWRGTALGQSIQQITTTFDGDGDLTSLELVRETLEKWRENYIGMGVKVWCYTCYDSQGHKVKLNHPLED